MRTVQRPAKGRTWLLISWFQVRVLSGSPDGLLRRERFFVPDDRRASGGAPASCRAMRSDRAWRQDPVCGVSPDPEEVGLLAFADARRSSPKPLESLLIRL